MKQRILTRGVLVLALSQLAAAQLACSAGFCLPGHHPAITEEAAPGAPGASCHERPEAESSDGYLEATNGCCQTELSSSLPMRTTRAKGTPGGGTDHSGVRTDASRLDRRVEAPGHGRAAASPNRRNPPLFTLHASLLI